MSKKKTVRVEILEDIPSLPLIKEFRAVSAHLATMGTLLDAEHFEDPQDGTALVIFIRDDGVAVGSFFRGEANARRIIDSFEADRKSGETFHLRQARRPSP